MERIKIHFSMRLDPKDHAKIKKIAVKKKRSLNNMIEYAVVKEIERYEAEYGEIPITEEDLGLE